MAVTTGEKRDPGFWVNLDPDDSTPVTVLMLPGHALAYQTWLAFNNLYLFPIPGVQPPAYTIGVRDMPPA